jgi:cbb3-type cytochrome oxidase maturation protein
MESLYVLIPVSLLLVGVIAGVLIWATHSGQFEKLDEAGRDILTKDEDERVN